METNNFLALKIKSSLYHISYFSFDYPGHKLTVPEKTIPWKIHIAFVYWISPKIMQNNFCFPSLSSLLIYWLVGFWQVCTFCSEHFLDVSLMLTFKRGKKVRKKKKEEIKKEKSRRGPKPQQAPKSVIVECSWKDNQKWNLLGVLLLKL